MSLNGVALTAAGGAPSNCTAGGYKTLGDAGTGVTGNCMGFSPSTIFQQSAIWACTGINLNESFKLTFTINFGTNTTTGDGMAFLLQTEGVPQSLGGAGGGLGYAEGDGSGCQGFPCPISPSVAVEFDTYQSAGLNDIAADHTSIQTNGIMTSGNTLSGPISLLTSGATVKDGAAHNVCITWDPALNRYIVFFDGVLRLQYNGNIRTLFSDPTNVYWGFTGASGGAIQVQTICSAAMLTNIPSPSCSCTAPVATATPNPQIICSGNATGVTLTSTVVGTTYTWSTPTNANITGETTTGGSGATITDILTNTTNTVQSVTYTVTPTAAGCVGAAFTVPVTVNPLPVMTSATAITKCSGVSVGLALTSNPSATSYSWIATANANVGGESTTAQSSSTISDVLTNATTSVQTVTYTVTPTLNGCAGTPQTLTVTVNPLPVMTSATTATICSGVSVGLALTSNPSATSYSWIATANANVGGESTTAQSSSTISDVLTNATTSAQTVTYTVTPTLNGCVGTPQTVTVTVNPIIVTPTITTAAATCSANGTASISNYDPTATYTFSPVGPTEGSTITGMTPGTSYTVTASNGTCTSTVSTSFSIAAQLTQPSTPTITTTPATCLANGTATLTNYSGTLSYTFSPVGPTAGSTITGMTPATSYTVTASNGSCSSTASTSFSVNAQLTVPVTPAITTTAATCSAAGTASISNYDPTQTYTFTPSGPSAGAGGVISSMTSGMNYTVTTSNGTCTSLASTSFSFEAQFSTPSAPVAGTNATYCNNSTPDALSAQGTGTFTWYSDAALSVQIGTGEAYTPSITIGTTDYFVTQTENGCESSSSMVQITIEECSIIIPTAITPDNDGVNDTWTLENIDQIYPENVVSIHNRWGNIIYQSKVGQYELTPWDGTLNGEKMPAGSYYFVIEYNDGISTSITGIVTLIQ